MKIDKENFRLFLKGLKIILYANHTTPFEQKTLTMRRVLGQPHEIEEGGLPGIGYNVNDVQQEITNIHSGELKVGVRANWENVAVVQCEISQNNRKTLTGEVNLSTVIKKLRSEKKDVNFDENGKKETPFGMDKVCPPAVVVNGFNNFAGAFLYFGLITPIIGQYIYRDKDLGKYNGFYCNIKIPIIPENMRESKNDYEFHSEFLYPMNYINTDNFFEKLAIKSDLNLQPYEILFNYQKTRNFFGTYLVGGYLLTIRFIFIPVIYQVIAPNFCAFYNLKLKGGSNFIFNIFMLFLSNAIIIVFYDSVKNTIFLGMDFTVYLSKKIYLSIKKI